MANYYDEYRNDLYDPDDGHDSVTPGLNANWKAIQKGFKTVEDDINDLTTKIEKAEDAIEDLDTRLTNTETDIDNIDASLTELTNRVTSAESNIDNHADRLTNAETDIDNLESNVTDLTDRVTSAENNITNHGERLTNAETDIDNLESNVADLTDRVTSAENNITNHAERLTQIESTLPGLINRVSANETNINSLSDLIDDIQDELTGIFNRFSSLDITIDSHNSRITALENSLASLTTRVQTLESDIAIIKTEQTQQNSRLTSLENNVTQILNAINTLNTRMTNVESELGNKQDVGNYVTLYQYSTNVDSLAIDYDVDESTDGTETTDSVNLGFKPTTSQNYGDMQFDGSGFGFGVGVTTRDGYKYLSVSKRNDLNINHCLELNLLGDTDANPFVLDLDAVKSQTEKTVKQGTYMFTQADGVNGNSYSRFNINVNISGLEIGRQYLFLARVIEPSVPSADSVNLVYTLLTPVNNFSPSSATIGLPISIMFQNLGSNPISLYNPRYSVNVIAIPI